jgi:integrase
MQTLERHAFPILGNLPVNQINKTDVLAVLTPIWGVRQETARRVRQRIRTVMQWAMANDFIERNPAGEVIDGGLPPMPKLKAHLRALPFQEVREALRIIEASQASIAAKLCLRFTVLTAARSGEARGALWGEIDIQDALRTIPPQRMKGGIEHKVPLSNAALDVLGEAQKLRDGTDLVFPSPTGSGQPLSDMTLTKVLRATGLADRATVHGFRSSFRDWADICTSAPDAAVELSLAHEVGTEVRQAYARSDLLDLREPLMEAWAEYITE